jgi:hypothetical protein
MKDIDFTGFSQKMTFGKWPVSDAQHKTLNQSIIRWYRRLDSFVLCLILSQKECKMALQSHQPLTDPDNETLKP